MVREAGGMVREAVLVRWGVMYGAGQNCVRSRSFGFFLLSCFL